MNQPTDRDSHTATRASNDNMQAAQHVQNDEFYTLLGTIESELVHYKLDFHGKVVLCNCDDPKASQFHYFFRERFARLGLKKLITTCYRNQNPDLFSRHDCEKAVRLEYTGSEPPPPPPHSDLEGNGDFRSEECVALLQQADIVVTNPPFSLFREYIAQLIKHDKKFLIIGNFNAITYKEVFPLIKSNQIWLGVSSRGMNFKQPDESIKNVNAVWYTNLSHDKRNEELELYNSYNPVEYPKYDNYNAIEVGKVNEIPNDYPEAMGVPITFMDHYNPEQFEIIGMGEDNGRGHSGGVWLGGPAKCLVNGVAKFKRLFIKHKRA